MSDDRLRRMSDEEIGRFASARAKIGAGDGKGHVSVSMETNQPKVRMTLAAYEAIASELAELRYPRWRKSERTASFEYWVTIGAAVLILLAGTGGDEHMLLRYFGAAYMVLHAHGRRILAAVRATGDKEPPA